LPEITTAGATLAVISPQVARTPRETEEPKPLSFELLRDFGNQVAEKYGLVFTLPGVTLFTLTRSLAPQAG